MIEQDVIQEVLKIQNEKTRFLADSIVESAELFKMTLDFKYIINIIMQIDTTLLTNGVFLREVLDTVEETNYSCDN